MRPCPRPCAPARSKSSWTTRSTWACSPTNSASTTSGGGERHFLEGYCHVSAPETFLAALAVLTQRIRLSHGIVTLQPKMNHPIRVAERVACIDLLSHGRVDFGSGRGSGEKERGGFGVQEPETRSAWLESLRAIVAMWQTDRFTWEGEHFSIPERNVIPKPVQQPHPPLWLACTNPDTQRLAGELGMGSLAFLYAGLDDVAERVRIYREALANPKARFTTAVNSEFAFFTGCVLDDDERRAGERFLEERRRLSQVSWGRLTGGTLKVERPAAVADDAESLIKGRGALVGSPRRAIETIHAYAEAGIDQTVFSISPGMGERGQIERNLRRFAEDVIPAFRGKSKGPPAAAAATASPVP